MALRPRTRRARAPRSNTPVAVRRAPLRSGPKEPAVDVSRRDSRASAAAHRAARAASPGSGNPLSHPHGLEDLRGHLIDGASRIDHRGAFGLGGGAREIAFAHALEELGTLALEAIRGGRAARAGIASPHTLEAGGHGRIQQQGEIRTHGLLHQALELRDALEGESAAGSLVSVSRVGEAIADHPAARLEMRLDEVFQ